MKTKKWKKNQIPKKDKNWFDQGCQTIRKKLRTLSNQKRKDLNNTELHLLYSETLKQNKHALRRKKADYIQKQLTKIEKLQSHFGIVGTIWKKKLIMKNWQSKMEKYGKVISKHCLIN